MAMVKKHHLTIGYLWLVLVGTLVFGLVSHEISNNRHQIQQIAEARRGACLAVDDAMSSIERTALAGIRETRPPLGPESFESPELYQSALFQYQQTLERNAQFQIAADNAKEAQSKLLSGEYCNP